MIKAALLHTISYNTRLQPTAIQLGTSGAPTSRLNLTYSFGTTTNNGNVLGSTVTIDTEVWNQTFTYEALNRVTSKTYNDNGVTPNVIYKYDAQALPAGAPASTVFNRGASTGRLV